jgi:AraC-like DNA-binding protein
MLPSAEWTKYYRVDGASALHARFVTHRYPRHAHAYGVVGLVESGAQAYWYRGARHVTPAGQVFIVNPGEPHTGEAATATGYVYRTLYLEPCPHVNGAVLSDRALAVSLARFHDSLALGASKLEQDTLLVRALALLARHSDAPVNVRRAGRESRAVARARDFIESQCDQDISLAMLATLVGLSPYYFARVFEKATGLPPHAYLEGVRIAKACELLGRGASIVSSAISVGYADQSHLTRRFKRFLGITPGQYVRALVARTTER